MATFSVLWVLDFRAEVLSGLGTPVPGDPIILLTKQKLEARWPPPAPVWYEGADPWVFDDWETIYAGSLSAYSGPVSTTPGMAELAQFQLDLVHTLGPRQDLRYTIVGGAPTSDPQRYGQAGELEIPDDWYTDALSTTLLVYVFPPDGGWCMRGHLYPPGVLKRIARHVPGSGEMVFVLDDNAAFMGAPLTSGDIHFAVEVDGVVTDLTLPFTPFTGDFFGGRLFELTAAEGWSPPGWSGRIFSQVDYPVTPNPLNFPKLGPYSLDSERTHLIRWRVFDHEGRTTPWIHYLVPPIANVEGVATFSTSAESAPSDENTLKAELDEPLEFVAVARDADGEIVRWDWELDGQTSTGQTITHTFTDHATGGHGEGLYSVLLRVFDNDGLSNFCEFYVSVDNGSQVALLKHPHGPTVTARCEGVDVVLATFDQGTDSRMDLVTFPSESSPSLWLNSGRLFLATRTSSGIVLRSSLDTGETWTTMGNAFSTSAKKAALKGTAAGIVGVFVIASTGGGYDVVSKYTPDPANWPADEDAVLITHTDSSKAWSVEQSFGFGSAGFIASDGIQIWVSQNHGSSWTKI